MNTLKDKGEIKVGDKVVVNFADGHTRYRGVVIGLQGKMAFVDAEYAKIEFVETKFLTSDEAITQAKKERTEEIRMELEEAIVHITKMPNGHTTLIEVSNEFLKELRQPNK